MDQRLALAAGRLPPSNRCHEFPVALHRGGHRSRVARESSAPKAEANRRESCDLFAQFVATGCTSQFGESENCPPSQYDVLLWHCAAAGADCIATSD
ncbi:MAG TPA: hypothetical protein VMM15_04770 [Bradyrhizobium sp.]|nr:hypothetical protein [Bradyrhizobium sp.]